MTCNCPKHRIVALRNEKGSYNYPCPSPSRPSIVALRNEKGSYNKQFISIHRLFIVALRNEKGSYNYCAGII